MLQKHDIILLDFVRPRPRCVRNSGSGDRPEWSSPYIRRLCRMSVLKSTPKISLPLTFTYGEINVCTHLFHHMERRRRIECRRFGQPRERIRAELTNSTE